jgi:hypothetical protein
MNVECTSCGAEWGAGAFTAGCAECGGGAMARPCLFCGGRCGAWWRRAPTDSNDARLAHWLGGCALGHGERDALLRAQARASSASRPPTLD